jgi:hypothetical protein
VLPRYRFRWSNLPADLLAELCEQLFDDCAGFAPTEVLGDAYGARPKENFVADAWDTLREDWLRHDKESRERVVEALRAIRREGGQITNRRAQMEYLRELSNAKTLRAVVLQAFVEGARPNLSTLRSLRSYLNRPPMRSAACRPQHQTPKHQSPEMT